jgi:hypothetical protein
MASLPEADKHQYLTDATGKRTHIVLPIEEYEELLEEAWHHRVVTERRGGEIISLDEMKRRLELE